MLLRSMCAAFVSVAVSYVTLDVVGRHAKGMLERVGEVGGYAEVVREVVGCVAGVGGKLTEREEVERALCVCLRCFVGLEEGKVWERGEVERDVGELREAWEQCRDKADSVELRERLEGASFVWLGGGEEEEEEGAGDRFH